MKSSIKMRVLTVIVVLVILAGGISVYAAVRVFLEIQHTLNTGGVNIELESLHIQDGKEIPLEGKQIVDFYGNVSYIPRISNKAESCYVRVNLTANTAEQQVDIFDGLYGVDSHWKRIGQYLYSVRPLDCNECIDICKGFDVPDDWDYIRSNDLEIKVTADAIQSKNFMPDFDSDTPWGDVAVLESKTGDGYTVNTVGRSEVKGNVRLVCDDGIAGIDVNTDNFFRDMMFMPGDEYSGYLTLCNRSSKRAAVLLKTGFENSYLLNMIQMRISNGSEFYNGSAAGEALKEYREIFVLEPGEKRTIEVDLSLPEYAGNSCQIMKGSYTWYLAVREYTDDAVDTGDNSFLWIFIAACFASAFAAYAVIRKKENEDI